MNMTPLEYGKQACDAIMKRISPERLNPEGTFFYHQGVFLSGMQKIYELCGEKKYFQYVKDYVDSVLGPNGEIPGDYHEYVKKSTNGELRIAKIRAEDNLDRKQPGIILFQLYEETGDEKYRKAIESLANSIHYWPVNTVGGLWHSMKMPYQIWMDSAYMAAPLCVMYAKRFGDDLLRERAINHLLVMEQYMKDKESGLYYHGWDESKCEAWANKETGLSAQFWGRAVGWYTVAILDVLENISKEHPAVSKLKQIEAELLNALTRFRDEKTGMWFEVLDQTMRVDNWIESSCTNLFIYSYARAMRMGIIGREYEMVVEKAYKGIERLLYYDEGGEIVIDHVCTGTAISEGTYEYYIARPRIKNDLHGMGAFVLMCAEMERYFEEKYERL